MCLRLSALLSRVHALTTPRSRLPFVAGCRARPETSGQPRMPLRCVFYVFFGGVFSPSPSRLLFARDARVAHTNNSPLPPHPKKTSASQARQDGEGKNSRNGETTGDRVRLQARTGALRALRACVCGSHVGWICFFLLSPVPSFIMILIKHLSSTLSLSLLSPPSCAQVIIRMPREAAKALVEKGES